MSELGEYYQEERVKNQAEKEKRRKWNTDVVNGLSVEYDFKVWKCSETHFRLFHKKRGALNYWPSTQKGKWDNGQSFPIPDIEGYLMKHFKLVNDRTNK